MAKTYEKISDKAIKDTFEIILEDAKHYGKSQGLVYANNLFADLANKSYTPPEPIQLEPYKESAYPNGDTNE